MALTLAERDEVDAFKFIIDPLTAAASLVAIVVALASWYRSARKPLAIDRLVIHQKADKSTFILSMRNRKDYPIIIKQTQCYTRRYFTVQKNPQRDQSIKSR
ncbi:hypothetical protein BOW52_07920 [Solemya elarraichensis gill symbiont]|uniref:Uncharacterized protein n=1 Tax=Solemya elarraichensis gill symbiont TaxID=1918949 RepID=A0A1T2L1E8_9GAMM|nr:hypothetical protein BOW52_07920 [Solemya elarraichensis gill symbiont]